LFETFSHAEHLVDGSEGGEKGVEKVVVELKLSKNFVILLVGLPDPLGLDLFEEVGLLWLQKVEVLEREVKLDEILA
jgi:hypothetical protein